MPIDVDRLLAIRLTARQRITPRDCMLYALGVGLGAKPLDEAELRFVYDEGLRVLPTMAITYCYPDLLGAYVAAGLDPKRVLHGHQAFTILSPLRPDAELIGDTAVTHLVDKGPGKALLVHYRTDIRHEASGEPVCRLESSSYCIGVGGLGRDAGGTADPSSSSPMPTPMPMRACDAVFETKTLPQAALLYRLSGDYNPLHASPAVAHAAGFKEPILHGRCSFGVAGHALLASWADLDPARMQGMSARFSATVFPGETLRTEMWREGPVVRFRTRVVERDVVALDHGEALIA